MPKFKNPYTYPHKSRLAKVDYICGIGGYSNRDGRWPIEFNVATYLVDFDFDHIWDRYASEHIPPELMVPDLLGDTAGVTKYKALAKQKYAETERFMWEWGVEDACRGLMDDDTYRMLWDGTMVDAVLELRGRGGKHLVIAGFNGKVLEGMNPKELHDYLMLQHRESYRYNDDETSAAPALKPGWAWDVSTKELDIFYKYARQCEVDFTVEKASADVEYLGAWQFFVNIVNSAWEEGERAQREEEAE